jgi:death-on-curing protein
VIEEPSFLALEDVLEIHAAQLARYGGQDGIRDRGLLLSAMAQPEMSFAGEFLHEDLFAMAAAYAFHLAENQPFIDGNKRTAFQAADVFLMLNGFDLPASKRWQVAMIDSAKRKLDKAGLALLFRKFAKPTDE